MLLHWFCFGYIHMLAARCCFQYEFKFEDWFCCISADVTMNRTLKLVDVLSWTESLEIKSSTLGRPDLLKPIWELYWVKCWEWSFFFFMKCKWFVLLTQQSVVSFKVLLIDTVCWVVSSNWQSTQWSVCSTKASAERYKLARLSVFFFLSVFTILCLLHPSCMVFSLVFLSSIKVPFDFWLWIAPPTVFDVMLSCRVHFS